jgi:exosortase E/protease (VPEID-CTERM system)
LSGQIHRAVTLRLALLTLLFFLEYEAAEVLFRRFFEPAEMQASPLAPLADLRGYLLVSAVLLVAVFGLVIAPRLPAHWSRFRPVAAEHAWRGPLAAQIVAYAISVLATAWILRTPYRESGVLGVLMAVGWLASMVATAALALLTLAPVRWWADFARRERASLAGGLAAAFIAAVAGYRARELLPELGLRDLTMRFAEALLRLRYDEVVSVPGTRTLGTPGFQVEITDACAGYEGMALVTLFLSLYLSLFRRDFRFPRVLVMFPVGILVIWAFNLVRIAALVIIGTELSPGVAIAGFHSNAGWIAFTLVSFGLLAIVHRLPFFAASGRTRRPAQPVREADALLVPMVALLAATLLTSAFSAGFDWLYPLKVVATAAALWVFRGSYRLPGFRVSTVPVAIGSGVFLLWLALVPAPADASAAFGAHLQAMPAWAAGVWVMFRVLGSAITVPLAEELAFRGYLLARLGGNSPTLRGAVPFAWFPFLASSILFGLFHGDWVAGTLAGAAYAAARYWRGEVGDAVVAHVATNALLSVFVLATQRWAYW